MSIEEEVLSTEEDPDKYKFVRQGPAYMGKPDYSGLYFIVSVVGLFTMFMGVIGVLNMASTFSAGKPADTFSLSHDLHTYPSGNAWVVAGMALAMYAICISWLIVHIIAGWYAVLIEAHTGDRLVAYAIGAYQCILTFALFVVIVVGFLFA